MLENVTRFDLHNLYHYVKSKKKEKKILFFKYGFHAQANLLIRSTMFFILLGFSDSKEYLS